MMRVEWNGIPCTIFSLISSDMLGGFASVDVVLVCRLNELDSILCFAFALIVEDLLINSFNDFLCRYI